MRRQRIVGGANELTLSVSRITPPGRGGDPRSLGLALHAVHLTRQ